MGKIIAIGAIVVILVGGFWWFINFRQQQASEKSLSETIPDQKQVTEVADSKMTEPATGAVDKKTNEIALPYTAGFAIFTHGTYRVFTAAMYHNQSSEVFIQADNPNRVHITAQNIKWSDFFDTLPFKLDPKCLTTGTGQVFCTNEKQTLKFFINGTRDDQALSRIIMPGDKLLVSVGPENDDVSKQLARVP